MGVLTESSGGAHEPIPRITHPGYHVVSIQSETGLGRSGLTQLVSSGMCGIHAP